MLSKDEIEAIEHEVANYPRRQAACIEALKIVQAGRGWISDESLQDVATLLEMTADELDSIATFYNLIHRRPVGRHVIHICDSVSCWIMGYGGLRKALQERLGIDLGETSRDGLFTLLPIPCLGTCDHAPALMVDEDLYRDLAADQLDEVLARYA